MSSTQGTEAAERQGAPGALQPGAEGLPRLPSGYITLDRHLTLGARFLIRDLKSRVTSLQGCGGREITCEQGLSGCPTSTVGGHPRVSRAGRGCWSGP